jgi:hypothetical protein
MELTLKAAKNFQTSTNNSIYPIHFLHYESVEAILSLGKTVYLNIFGKVSEQNRLTRGYLSLFPVVTAIFCSFSQQQLNAR